MCMSKRQKRVLLMKTNCVDEDEELFFYSTIFKLEDVAGRRESKSGGGSDINIPF